MAVNLGVSLRRGETPERLIRRFIKKCKREKILDTYREKTDYYIKPSIKKRSKRQKAIREHQKAQRANDTKLFR